MGTGSNTRQRRTRARPSLQSTSTRSSTKRPKRSRRALTQTSSRLRESTCRPGSLFPAHRLPHLGPHVAPQRRCCPRPPCHRKGQALKRIEQKRPPSLRVCPPCEAKRSNVVCNCLPGKTLCRGQSK